MERSLRGAHAVGAGLVWLAALGLPGPRQAVAQEPSGERQNVDPGAIREARLRTFSRTRALLLKYRVPFEPNLLLENDWRLRLGPVLDSIPEMQQDRVESGRLRGLYLANRLVLRGERIEARGDVVVIARHLVFVGPHTWIHGPGRSVSMFIVDSTEHYLTEEQRLSSEAAAGPDPQKVKCGPITNAGSNPSGSSQRPQGEETARSAEATDNPWADGTSAPDRGGKPGEKGPEESPDTPVDASLCGSSPNGTGGQAPEGGGGPGHAAPVGPDLPVSWLHQQALQAGGKYSLSIDGGYDVIDDMDLALLTEESDIIIVGRTGCGLPSRLSADGRSLNTAFKVTIGRVLKGDLLTTNSVTVVTPGGRMAFPDGSVAQVLLHGPFDALAGEETYVMFLKGLSAGLGYEPTGGPQGLYQVQPDHRIRPLDLRREARVATRYRETSLESFLAGIAREIRAAAAKPE